jgi:hypothetical protein
VGREARVKKDRRQIRKALGPEVVDGIRVLGKRTDLATHVLTRGFFGRLRWLLRGR